MKKIQLLSLAAVAAVLLGSLPAQAHGHGGVSVGIGLGFPCWGWGCGGWYRPYPYYYPYYYPAPVVVAPSPVVQAVPVAVAATPPASAVAATPAPLVASTPAPANIPAPTTIFRAAAPVSESGTQYLEQLRNPDAGIRQNAVMELGKQRVDQAVDPLSATLAGDSNPAVREAAARALGLIAAPRSLPALIRAAQADNDREVRHSAQFAVEVIRGNLRQQ
jgi:hypothetical protein